MNQTTLKSILHYDPETGNFTWLQCHKNSNKKAGDIAGSIKENGYRTIKVFGRARVAHRLAWFYVHGYFPPESIDHINGVRDDNRISNLRLANHSENNQNRSLGKNNKSGFMGVSSCANGRRWRAVIRKDRRLKHLGYFDSPEVAYAAYLEAKAILHTYNPTQR
jgi:hypothetical protein